MNKTRPQSVGILLGVIATLGLGFLGYQRFVVAPIDGKRKELIRAEDQASDALTKVGEARLAASDLAEVARLALPGDPRQAIEKYQVFLLDLLKSVDVKNLTLSPESPRKALRSDELHIIPFSIAMETDIWSITKFLQAFYQAPRLHQITNLSLTPMDRKDTSQSLRVALKIEALALVDAESAPHGADWTFEPPVDSDRDAYGLLVERNVLFASGPGSTSLHANDPEHVVLTSIWQQGSVVEADLFDRAQNQARRVRLGEECTVGRVRAVIVDVGYRDMVLQIDGNLYLWSIGHTFSERTLLSAEEALDREVRNLKRRPTMN